MSDTKMTTGPKPPVQWVEVPRQFAKDGDLAKHVYRDLDDRKVSTISADKELIWLDIMGQEHGPFDAEDYTYWRRAEVTV